MAEYRRLFNVDVTHTFYTDGICRDFDIVPTPETLILLKQNRLRFRNDNLGFRVLYETMPASSTPFIDFGGFKLTFYMVLKNLNGFQNITHFTESLPGPDKQFTSGNLVYFTNESQTANTLKYSIIDSLKSTSFTFKFPQTGGMPADNGQVIITNESGINVTPSYPDPNAVKADPEGNFYFPIDFSSLPAGLYNFATTINGVNPPAITKIYIDTSLIRKTIFGLIKVNVVDWEDFPSSRNYHVKFINREARWRYKIVLKTIVYNPLDEYAVKDETAEYTFEEQSEELTNGVPTLVFQSTVKIPFKETPRKFFKFVKDPNGTPIDILKDLSNPPYNLVSAYLGPPLPVDFGKSVIYITV